MTEHESPWQGDALDTVLSFFAWEDSLCQCGRPSDETTGKANTFRFVAELKRCHACKARDMLAAQLRKQGGSPGGMIVVREAEGWTPEDPGGR